MRFRMAFRNVFRDVSRRVIRKITGSAWWRVTPPPAPDDIRGGVGRESASRPPVLGRGGDGRSTAPLGVRGSDPESPGPGWRGDDRGYRERPTHEHSIGDVPRAWGSASRDTLDAWCRSVVRRTRGPVASAPASGARAAPSTRSLGQLWPHRCCLDREGRTGGTSPGSSPCGTVGWSHSAVGCSVTFQWTIRRVPTSSTTKT